MQFLPAHPDVMTSCASNTFSLVNFNPDRMITHDFGARAQSKREAVYLFDQDNFGMNSCDSHAPSGMVVCAGDCGGVVMTKLDIAGSHDYGLQLITGK